MMVQGSAESQFAAARKLGRLPDMERAAAMMLQNAWRYIRSALESQCRYTICLCMVAAEMYCPTNTSTFTTTATTTTKKIFAAGTTACHDLAFSPPARQLASSLLVVNPTFLQDDNQGQDYSGLRKLQSVFLAPQKVVRTAVVEDLLRPNIEWEEPRSAGVAGRNPQD
jgi:hypothetical protein